MCTRYASDLTMDDWAMLYDLAMEGPPPWNFEPSYNVVITQTIPVMMLRDGKRVLERMRWGIIPHKHNGTIKDHKLSTHNTRSESVETSWTFGKIWQRHRCLIPVSGFYEWHHREGKPKKEPPQPYYFTDAHGAPCPDDRRDLRSLERSGERRPRAALMLHDDDGAERACCQGA
jgi:putative SOS response-associated peptidase YedK